MQINKTSALRGTLTLPGDKSISHRACMFGALAEGDTEVSGFLRGADCLSTLSCFRKMGIHIEEADDRLLIHGKGLHGLQKPSSILDTGNSGTTMRLLCGILAGQSFSSVLTGDESLQKRPMNRVITPLSQMGAQIHSREGFAPLSIDGSPLSGITYTLPVASAQLKSAILLAGLYAKGTTAVIEPVPSRNHTECMLKEFGAEIKKEGELISLSSSSLYAHDISVPGDISSAAFFLVVGLIIPNSEIVLRNVGVNPTRAGVIEVLQKMGGQIELLNLHGAEEPVADLVVRSSSLHGVEIAGNIIPTLIDELPIIAVAAMFAKGKTIIRDAAELRVKETDRIAVIAEEFSKCGAQIVPTEDGMMIEGSAPLHFAKMNACTDHRIAMCEAVLGLAVGSEIEGAECVSVSYPEFFSHLDFLREDHL